LPLSINRAKLEPPLSSSRSSGGGCNRSIVPVSPVSEPTNNDQWNSSQVEKPSDNDQSESRTVVSIEKGVGSVIVVEPSLGGSPGDDDDEEGDEGEEVGEELEISLYPSRTWGYEEAYDEEEGCAAGIQVRGRV
jgi:hypothetical protein